MSAQPIRPPRGRAIERPGNAPDALRRALEDALRRIERLEDEVARLRGERPAREEKEA